MTEQTRISSSGEVVVPRDVVAGQGWTADTELELVASPEGVLIRPKSQPRETISWEEFRRRVPKHEGPALSLEQMDAAIERGRAERWKAKEAASR